MPDFYPVAGHFLSVRDALKELPQDTATHYMFWRVSKTFKHSGVWYISFWPYQSKPLLIVTAPDAASQVESHNLEKGEDLVGPFERITGGKTLLTLEGAAWKSGRAVFNPGFSPGYLTGLAPTIVTEVTVFCDLLRRHAISHELFQLETLTMNLAFDIISAVVLDVRTCHQTTPNPIAIFLRRQINWTSYGTTLNPFKRYTTIRPLVQWVNGLMMDRHIATEIDAKFRERITGTGDTSGASKQSRSIMSLLMDDLLEENKSWDHRQINKALRELIIPHLRLFLFAGHDTTSATMNYCFYVLAKHPEALSRVIAEHDEVFGTDLSQVSDIIAKDPHRLNRLPYTSAVIKETLRIFAPAGAALRRGEPGVEIVDETGRRFPTEGCNIWMPNLIMHHNPKYWKDPEAFIPERWIVGPDDPLYPVKGAWRAFEAGPRNCLGQTLAQLELRIVLLMVIREFKIEPAYEEWDTLHPRPGIKTTNGIRAYQAERGGGGAHPSDNFPVRVSLRNRK
ncbi:cytochrome P450 [Lophiostoma macrostomum CBS 122681]|uniref:Cytochrome P450 n=1 Tax=Lophiostoma macrostomum CBS 122681 TaxID=1314788 RepID=A0A6A6T8R6_9PLEO|nr:cytochrome P450 [Lophiostoma macrostomum CBS 122681]